MIKLETIEDIELLKELISTLGHENTVDESRMIAIQETQEKLLKEIESLNQKISVLSDNVSTASKDREVKEEIIIPKRSRLRNSDDFIPYSNSQEEYQRISLQGEKIIHTFLNKGVDRDSELPVNIFELLSIIERFKKGNDSIKVKEVDTFCKMFGISKVQFSKIYYNLLHGKFDGIISEMDKMIAQSLFTIEKHFIYRNNHDTGVDIKTFREVVSIYANSPNPLCAACKLIHEKNDIDSFDLFVILRKSGIISKIIEGEE